jgi:ribonuclease-3
MKKAKLPKNPENLATSLDYVFNDRELLLQAVRHPSYVYETDDPSLSDNQRLEFLGDSVINLAITHLLMESFPEMKEGELSKNRASLVSETGLYPLACELHMGDYLLLGKGEERTEGRKKPSILTDALEALVGAIYLDGGFDDAVRVIAKLFGPTLDRVSFGESLVDYKTELQEYSQEAFQSTPEYRLERETGPDHDKTFYAAVYLKGERMGKGKGKSKKEAERMAAKEALSCLTR